MAAVEIERLIRLLSRLPGLGPRSARKAALAMMKRPETVMAPLSEAIDACIAAIRHCSVCHNLDTRDPCALCSDPQRQGHLICVVQEVEDLWALERAGSYRGLFHVLGGTLSAIDDRGPNDLRIQSLIDRIEQNAVEEVVLALSATVDGQTTAHYIAERLKPSDCLVTRLAHGVPVGGELNYLDDGTIEAALLARQRVG